MRDELVASLRDMLRAHGRPLLQHEASTKELLDLSVTKKKRQEMLALFFRCVFAEVSLRYAFVVSVSVANWLARRNYRKLHFDISDNVFHLHLNPFKPSDAKWLHFKAFKAILV